MGLKPWELAVTYPETLSHQVKYVSGWPGSRACALNPPGWWVYEQMSYQIRLVLCKSSKSIKYYRGLKVVTDFLPQKLPFPLEQQLNKPGPLGNPIHPQVGLQAAGVARMSMANLLISPLVCDRPKGRSEMGNSGGQLESPPYNGTFCLIVSAVDQSLSLSLLGWEAREWMG